MGNLEAFLKNYTIQEVLLFVVLLALALRGAVEFFDWAKKRLKQVFDKDHAEQQRRERVDNDIDALQRLKVDTDTRMCELQKVDAQILDELGTIKATVMEYFRLNDQRHADSSRAYILHFNTELVRRLAHTEEDFIEVLSRIDEYERYCNLHQDYRNNRATSAINNIKRVYEERLAKGDFHAETGAGYGEGA